MVEIFGIVCGCGSLVLDLSRLNVNCSDDALSLQFTTPGCLESMKK
jgi:hypothetical protein